MLKTSKVIYSYPGGAEFNFPDLSVAKGEQVLLLGNSGSGKSTYLHILAGILRAKSGSICINNTEITRLRSRHLDRFRGSNIGMIFQKPLFISSLSVGQNLRLAQTMPGNKLDLNRIDTLLKKLDVDVLVNKKPGQCSEGELQRLSVVRALINKPSLILADEPTASLDDENCDRFVQLLKETCLLFDISLFIVTHDKRVKEHVAKFYTL